VALSAVTAPVWDRHMTHYSPAGTSSAPGPSAHTPLLSARGLSRTYGTGDQAREVVSGVDLEIDGPGMTAIIGPSGSGKSTLLFCLSGLERPTGGQVSLLGTDLARARAGKVSRLYQQQVGFVFQAYNLVPYLSARRNTALPGMLADRRDAFETADGALASLGLAEKADEPVTKLSGGQQQRVALARVLAQDASVIFADEPTGALDTATSAMVMDRLRERADAGAAVVVVTHELESAVLADRVVLLRDGHAQQAPAGAGVRELAALMEDQEVAR
jgi:putative ABC transport system ATP-binding protein